MVEIRRTNLCRLSITRSCLEGVQFKRPTLDRTAARLKRAHTIADLRDIAKRATPKAPFDYADGSAEAELSSARTRQAFQDIEFHPAILRDVSAVGTTSPAGVARADPNGRNWFQLCSWRITMRPLLHLAG